VWGEKGVGFPRYFVKNKELVTDMGQAEDQLGKDVPPTSLPFQQDRPISEPARLGPFGRLTGTLLSPGETFQDINRKPTIIAPIVIAILTAVALSLFVSWQAKPDWKQIARSVITRQNEKLGVNAPPDQVEKQVEISATIDKFLPVVYAISTPIVFLIGAGVLALGMLLMQAQTTFKKILSVFSWVNCSVGLVNAIVAMASLMVRDPQSLRAQDFFNPWGIAPTNLSYLLADNAASALRSLASFIDFFGIWRLALLIIGLAAIAATRKITTRKTAGLVIGLWLVIVLISVGLAAVGLGGQQ
jgi:hypothetical protein